MKILLVNKFLFPKGGAETYVLKIGKELEKMGHEVQFFGMDDENRIVGNAVGKYISKMDFHTKKIERFFYPFKIIYSLEARIKIKDVLLDFKPDVVHLNNFNFQITPSILYEIKRIEKILGKKIKVVYTAHDSQLICPNHLMYISHKRTVCEKCLGGKFVNCTKKKCIHNSRIKSILGSIEGYLYYWLKTYKLIDLIICPSDFLNQKLRTNSLLVQKTITLHNFIDTDTMLCKNKEDYIIYFGRYSYEKGIELLLEICRRLPDIPFVFAGSGPLEDQVNNIENIRNVGFLTGERLRDTISKARISIFPSVCYENCPFSVIESQMYGTPLIAANIGGVPEIIKDGETADLFESGNADDLQEKILKLWNDRERLEKYTKNCREMKYDTLSEYCCKLLNLYK